MHESPTALAETTASPDAPARILLGLQGPVVSWHDPWAPDESDRIMRTGTGVTIASQDPAPSPLGYVRLLREFGADFAVHQFMPTSPDPTALIRDAADAGVELVLGNELGNINGPYAPGTNRYDVPLPVLAEAAEAGVLAGILYDEAEHLQINADQYRKDAHLPHFADTTGLAAPAAEAAIEAGARAVVARTAHLTTATGDEVPVLSEHVFPVLFHALARAGMTPAPKVMKEAFQPLQLATALGAALQYGRQLWICADLWGPDIGPWFTRAPGFPGHSPEEYASALRMAYLFAPTRLYTESVDVLARHLGGDRFARTEFGEEWARFVRDFVPRAAVDWRFDQARADVVIVHADDSEFGRGALPFGNREGRAPETAQSIFQAWHLVSAGSLPAHASCMHVPGYDFPRHRLNPVPRDTYPLVTGDAAGRTATTMHPLFHSAPNVLVFDDAVTDAALGDPALIVAVGSRLSEAKVALLRRRAEAGAVVVIAEWLVPSAWRRSERTGTGQWVVSADLMSDDAVADAVAPFVAAGTWTQRFGETEVRITPADPLGTTLEFELVRDGRAERIS